MTTPGTGSTTTTPTPSPTAPSNSWLSNASIIGAILSLSGTVATGVIGFYTNKTNNETQAEIEKLKGNNATQIAKIESESKEQILKLTDALQADKDLRAKVASNELEDRSTRAKNCEQIAQISDGMVNDLSHLKYNDKEADESRRKLEVAYRKIIPYLSQAGTPAYQALSNIKYPPEETQLERNVRFFSEVAYIYSIEIRARCTKF